MRLDKVPVAGVFGHRRRPGVGPPAWARHCLGSLLLLAAWLAVVAPAAADAVAWTGNDANGAVEVHLWFFWSRHCPHCLEARPAVASLAEGYPWLRLHDHEVSADPANARLYAQMAEALGERARVVPGFMLCGRLITGFAADAATLREIEGVALACRARVAAGGSAVATATATQADRATADETDAPAWDGLALPLVTLLLAGMDAFNPCAFFVLLFLLSLLTHQHSRRRMALVAGVFVAASGLVYFALMAAWLNLFLIAGELRVVTLIAAVLAIAMGAINVKDYLAAGSTVSLSIPAAARPRLFERVRRLLDARRLPTMLFATLTLALAANSYELLCTAGFPMVYTRILTLRGLGAPAYYAYLALYNLIYVLPLLAIVLVYLRTLGSRKLSEREGRVLKLVSGVMMLGLGLALGVAPALLSDPLVAFALVAVALATGWLAWRSAG